MLHIICDQLPSFQDLWIRNRASPKDSLQVGAVFAHTKYGAGKYQEATLLLNLKNKRVLFGRLRFPAKELVRVVESVALDVKLTDDPESI